MLSGGPLSAEEMPLVGAPEKLSAIPRKQDDEVTRAGSADVSTILQCLKSADRLHVDSIIEGSGLTVATVLKLLLELELKGVVTQHPGKLFSLSSI
jgi:predicted Rossmann fold nucleotide-binding protein DprA/Smf involved in DNA uptake